MKRISAIIILGAIIVSCNPEKKYAEEIKVINKYEQSLDSLSGVYETIKFDSLIYIQKEAFQAEKMIKRYYTADTIATQVADRMQYIKSVRKSLSDIEIKQVAIAKEIDALKLQFKNLKTDIKNGVLGTTQIESYLAEEKEAYSNLSANLSNVLSNQTKQLRDFYYAEPVVSDYIKLIIPEEDQD